MRELILGGVKSGKSRFAESRAKALGHEVFYFATAMVGDAEMHQRIERHRAQRPNTWIVIEEPLYLAERLQQIDQPYRCILIDCLTLWMTNLLTLDEQGLTTQVAALLDVLPSIKAEILLVSNETNMGIIAIDALTRRYCDEMGMLHQKLSTLCERVTLLMAGIPVTLKESMI